jgi:hypothetical protein
MTLRQQLRAATLPTHLGSIQMEDGADGLDPKATSKSQGVFMAQYTKKRWRQEISAKDNGAGSRLHSAEIVYSFTDGDQCEGSANGARSGKQSSRIWRAQETSSQHCFVSAALAGSSLPL